MFPWRTINGEDTRLITPPEPRSITVINADIMYALRKYVGNGRRSVPTGLLGAEMCVGNGRAYVSVWVFYSATKRGEDSASMASPGPMSTTRS